MTKRVDPNIPRASSTGKVRNVRADQSCWRVKLQQSRIKFDDDQKEIYLREIAEHSRKGDACAAAGVGLGVVAKHRKNDPEFQLAEEAALAAFRDKVVGHVQRLALEGTVVRKFDKEGKVVDERTEYPIRLIELEARRVEPEYREKSSLDLNAGAGGGGVLLVPSGMSMEDFKARLASGEFSKPKPE